MTTMMMTVVMTVITFNGEEEDVDNVDAYACDEGYDGTQLS